MWSAVAGHRFTPPAAARLRKREAPALQSWLLSGGADAHAVEAAIDEEEGNSEERSGQDAR